MHKDLKPENVMMSSAKKAPIQERLGCFDVWCWLAGTYLYNNQFGFY